MRYLHYIGLSLLISALIVFAIMLPNATKCPMCRLCIDSFPNDYYNLVTCAGSACMAIWINWKCKDKFFLIISIFFVSMLLLSVLDKYVTFLPYGRYYAIALIAYTTALCIVIIPAMRLIKYSLGYLTRTFF
jgi:hypothetical protein